MESVITSLSIINPVIGVGCLTMAAYKHRARLAHLKKSEILEGTVVELEDDKYDDTKWTHVSVTVPDGRTEVVRGRVASNPPRFHVGQRVKVYYLASGSPRLLIADRWEIWCVVGIWYAFGIAGILTPILLALFYPYPESS